MPFLNRLNIFSKSTILLCCRWFPSDFTSFCFTLLQFQKKFLTFLFDFKINLEKIIAFKYNDLQMKPRAWRWEPPTGLPSGSTGSSLEVAAPEGTPGWQCHHLLCLLEARQPGHVQPVPALLPPGLPPAGCPGRSGAAHSATGFLTWRGGSLSLDGGEGSGAVAKLSPANRGNESMFCQEPCRPGPSFSVDRPGSTWTWLTHTRLQKLPPSFSAPKSLPGCGQHVQAGHNWGQGGCAVSQRPAAFFEIRMKEAFGDTKFSALPVEPPPVNFPVPTWVPKSCPVALVMALKLSWACPITSCLSPLVAWLPVLGSPIPQLLTIWFPLVWN